MTRFHAASPADTAKFATSFAERLRAGDVVALRGGMGVGKTTFVREVARCFGVEDEVSRPTFSIVNVYRSTPPICHFDLYRISYADELDDTGYYEYLDSKSCILFIEWSEKITDELPPDTIYIDIERISDNERMFTINGGERFVNIGG